jgi:hypothetical protein
VALAGLSVLLASIRPQVRSFDGTVASALADITGSDDLALARFRGLIWAMQGIAATSGPLIGSALAVFAPRSAYLAASVTSVIMALLVSLTPETLAVADRQPFRWSMVNPFSFLQLLLGTGPYRRAPARRKIQALGVSNGLMMLPIFGNPFPQASAFLRLNIAPGTRLACTLFPAATCCVDLASLCVGQVSTMRRSSFSGAAAAAAACSLHYAVPTATAAASREHLIPGTFAELVLDLLLLLLLLLLLSASASASASAGQC